MNENQMTPAEMEAKAVEDRASRLNDKLAELKASSRSLKRTGRLMAILVAVVAVAGAYLLLRPLLMAYNNPEPYQAAFRVEMGRQVIPALSEESQTLLKAVGPDILEAIQQNTSNRLPEITTKIEMEGRALAEELSAEASDRLIARSEKMATRLEKLLVAEVPQAADPAKSQVIVENGHIAAKGALDRFMKTYLAEHMGGVANLQDRIDTFPVPKHIQEMSDEELRAHLTETLGAYAMRHLSAARSPQMKEFMNSLNQVQTTEGDQP